MTANEILYAIHQAGGSSVVNGDRVKYSIPKNACWLLSELCQRRDQVLSILRGKVAPPVMSPGVRLVKYAPQEPPVMSMHLRVVNDLQKFVAATLRELKTRFSEKNFLAGNWTLRQLIERLEQVADGGRQ